VSASLNCCSSTAALTARTTSSNGLPSRLRRWLTSRCTSDEDQRVGWCRQVDGTAGLHSAPGTQAVTLGATSGQSGALPRNGTTCVAVTPETPVRGRSNHAFVSGASHGT
jgi:hypothetical protein